MEGSVFRGDLLKGKLAFITGGSSGINLRIAECFALTGAKVILNGRNPEKLAAAVASITSKGGHATEAVADVRDYGALELAMRKSLDGRALDILVCGAAGNFPAPAMGMSSNGFRAVLEIDVLGTFNACRAAFEHLKKPGGVVLNLSAPQAYVPMALQSHVCAAKAGVDMLTRTLALEWGGAGIRVNSLTPGPIEDTGGMERLAPAAETRQKLAKVIPLQRLGAKDDIANFALFLVSEAASYVTGAILVCDGGQSLVGGSAVLETLG